MPTAKDRLRARMAANAAREPTRSFALPVLIAAIVLLLWLFPRYVDQPRAYAQGIWQRLALRWAIERIEGVSSEALEIHRTADGSLLIVSKYSVMRVGADGSRSVLLTPQAVQRQTGLDVGAFSTAELAPDGALWVGGWHGAVLRSQGQSVQLLSTRDQPPRGHIIDILAADGTIYIGGHGLWRPNAAMTALEPVGDPELRVRALAIDAQQRLIVASERSLFKHHQGLLEPVWSVEQGDRTIEALTVDADGAWLVGTRSGVVVLEPDGRERTRLLPGVQVRGFARDARQRLWIGTWDAGVAVPHEDGWQLLGYAQGLPDDSVADLALDTKGSLWLAIYGDGAYRVDADRLETFTVARNPPVLDPAVRLYADACAAAAQEFQGGGESGQVAIESAAGQGHVFFGGRQVCPLVPGFRAGPGVWASVKDQALLIHSAGESRPRPLPGGLAASMVTAVYRDSERRWWLGTRHLGVFVSSEKGWTRFGGEAGFDNNPVQAIDGDPRGRIWVASYPPSETAGGRPGKAGLHRFDGQGWRAIVPRTGSRELTRLPARGSFRDLASRHANDLRVLPDGRVAVATNAGLSLVSDIDTIVSHDRYDLGLPSNFIAALMPDPDGRIWMTHAYWGPGLTWRAGLIFRNRDTRDGLFADRLTHLAHDADGGVWLRASDGRVAVYAREPLMR